MLIFSISGQTSGLYWSNLLSNIFYAPTGETGDIHYRLFQSSTLDCVKASNANIFNTPFLNPVNWFVGKTYYAPVVSTCNLTQSFQTK